MSTFSKSLLAIAVLALGGAAYYQYSFPSNHPKPSAEPANIPTQLGADAVQLRAGSPQLGYLKTAEVVFTQAPATEPLNGRMTYNEDKTSRVFSPINGRVLNIQVANGASVTKGQALVQIDAPDLAQAIADARRADSDLGSKKAAFTRAEYLMKNEVLARKDFETAQNDLNASTAEAARARARLKNLNANQNGDGTFVLRAPISGLVVDRQLNPGTEIRSDGQVPLVTITDPSHLWLSFELAESDLSRVHIGQAVKIESDAFAGQIFTGKVFTVSPLLDPNTRRIVARAQVENVGLKLRPEMYVRVTPLNDQGKKVIALSNQAVVTLGEKYYVFVETEPGLFKRRLVELSWQGREMSFVSGGIREGEKVVVAGALLLNAELPSR